MWDIWLLTHRGKFADSQTEQVELTASSSSSSTAAAAGLAGR